MENGIKKVNDHYQLPLLFRDPGISMPSNKQLFKRKPICLKRKSVIEAKFYGDDKKFMDDLISKSYATVASEAPSEGKVWYISYHGVYNPSKPVKSECCLTALLNSVASQSRKNL